MTYLKNINFILLGTWICILSSCSSDEPENKNELNCYLSSMTALEYSESVSGDFNSIVLRNCECYDSLSKYTWRYNVLLPSDYSDRKEYPVLYLLHGRSLTYHFWLNNLNLREIIDYYYKNNLLDVVVVMPEAQDTYYMDNYIENVMYESFFIKILIPEIEKKFSVNKDYNSRYIGGFSMGGYGAMYYTLKYDGFFSFCHSISAPLDGNQNPLSPSVFDFIEKEQKDYPRLILDIGLSDFLYKVNVESTLALRYLGIPHEFIARKGGHDSEFWKGSLYILFDRLSYFVAGNK